MVSPADQPSCVALKPERNAGPLIVLPSPPVGPPDHQTLLRRYSRQDMRFVPASSVRLLVNAAQAFPTMLSAIDGAQQNVALETYILRADATGSAFQQSLLRAAARGVRVRLLYDWLGSFGLPASFLDKLVRSGVAVAAYHPLVLHRPVWVLNHRDHRKMLIVDGQVSFTGGLNLADEYATTPSGGEGWRDTQVRLDGPEVARKMAGLFTYGWRRAVPYERTLTRRAMLTWGLRRRLTTWRRRQAERPDVTPGPGNLSVSVVGNEEFRFRRRIRRAYLKAICSAQRYVLIENAYFIPDRSVRRALTEAVRRGVVVAVVVPARSDVPITAYASRWVYGALLSGGVRIFEWPISMMHAKTAVFDDAWTIVGSYNFDRRSLLHQLESVVVVADPGLAAQLRDQTLADISRCNEVWLDAHKKRPWWQKTLEYLAYLLRHWL
jgi:cardiolipin synthase